jgi:hypothetical protein
LSDAWRSAPIVLLGPVAGELNNSLASAFSRSLVGAGAQGWLRGTAPDGRVQRVPPQNWNASPVLQGAAALFASDEDVSAEHAQEALRLWCDAVETVAFTRGYSGADVCYRGEWRHIGAFPANAVDPTGAGDVFAAAFLIRLHETSDPWESTRFASCAASLVVEGEGVTAVPDREMVEARLRAHPEIVALVSANDLSGVIQDLGIETLVPDERHDGGHDLVSMPVVVGDAGHADRGKLPGIMVIANFGGGNVETVVDASDQGFQKLALALERVVLGNSELYPADANGQGHGELPVDS